MNKLKVLFVCVHNSGRSQMAEALLRHLGGGHFEAESAGFEPGELNPIVIEALKEIGIDISQAKTKSVFDLYKQGRMYQYVVTVCDESSSERCPLFSGLIGQRMHWSFQDPASFKGPHEDRLAKTRVVRDQIKAKVAEFLRMSVSDAER